jgi:hypothetical protein
VEGCRGVSGNISPFFARLTLQPTSLALFPTFLDYFTHRLYFLYFIFSSFFIFFHVLSFCHIHKHSLPRKMLCPSAGRAHWVDPGTSATCFFVRYRNAEYFSQTFLWKICKCAAFILNSAGKIIAKLAFFLHRLSSLLNY